MPEQFEKLKPSSKDRKEPETTAESEETKGREQQPSLQLSKEQDELLLDIIHQAKQAEEQGNLEQAIKLYQQYKEEYIKIREEKTEKEKGKETEKEKGKEKEKITSPESFKLGARVRIRRDSEHADQNEGVGTIIEKREEKWATVKFDDGYQNNIYRIGKEGEFCDLELADED